MTRTETWSRKMPRTRGGPPTTRMFRLITDSEAAQAIHVAARLGLADLLTAEAMGVAALAEATGAHAASLYRLLRALASVGIFAETQAGAFCQTPLSMTLRTDAPGSLRALALLPPRLPQGEPWGDLLQSVLTGQPAFEQAHGEGFFAHLAHHPAEAAYFQAGMTRASEQHAPQLLACYDFTPFRKIVDLGGGQGAFLAAILRRTPLLRGVLLDLPQVVAHAHPITDREVTERCEIVGGDFFEGIPTGADAYLLKAILHDWSDALAERILRGCRQALPAAPTGRVLVFEMVVPPGNRPHPAKFLDLNLLALTPGGRERTRAEFRALFAAAGLRLKRIHPTAGPLCLLEGVPAKETVSRVAPTSQPK